MTGEDDPWTSHKKIVFKDVDAIVLSTLGFHCMESHLFSGTIKLLDLFKATCAPESSIDHKLINWSKPQVAKTDWLNELYWISAIGPVWA